ncbi:hypothetical protein [Lacticaseibacillus paracasei]|uniref:hypothetical protein n=1 Tax=Lacticaseibacillus paracasei TaxID=1597 RepID=UPI00059B41DE|nr:hypothetical protein [Lacticaseibacillus paracasei]
MALAIFNLLSIILIFIIIWLTRKEKVATRAGRYNRAFLIIIAFIEIVLIISETFIFKDSISLQSASFSCSLLLLINLLLSYRMH